MKQTDLPSDITHITERDFWSSLRPVTGRPQGALLARAIRLGRAGKKADAYAQLGAYHRLALADEWRVLRDQAQRQPAPAASVLDDLFRYKIATWHTQVYQFDRRIDWAPADLPYDCIHGFHYLHWLRPMVTALLQRPDDARVRAYLLDLLDQYYAARLHARWESVIRTATFSGLGIAAKWPTILAIYLGLLHSGDVPPSAIERVLKTILGFARCLDRRVLHTFVLGVNSYAVSNLTLFHIARAFAAFKESSRWDRKTVGYLVYQARQGYFADGGNLERVWGYGTMHVAGLSQPYAVAQRFGGLGRYDREILAALRRACQWYYKTLTPAPRSAFPTYGDAGWGAHDRMPTVQALARDVPGAEKDPLLGVDRTRSYLLRPSGFAILRNGDNPDSSYVNLSFGKFAGWHSHWDLLSMNFWSQGEPLLEELCRFGPYACPLDVLFRAPESHNLVLIDGMVYDSRLIEGQDVRWYSDRRVDYFSATHRAYRFFVYGRDASPVSPNIEALIRRTVLMVKDPGYVVVLDSVRDLNKTNFNLAISQYWHAPKPFRVVGPGQVRTEGHKACLLVYGQTESLHRLDTGKDFGGAEVAHLGVAYDRYSLRARRWLPLTHQGISGFTTVIYPFTGKMPKITVKALPSANGSPWKTEAIEVGGPHGRDRIVLNPEKMKGFAVSGRPVSAHAAMRLDRGRGACVVRAR